MPNAIWTGSISFGLVTVPVRMISATRSLDVRFHQLEEGTGSRIRLPADLGADRRRGPERPDREGLRDRARPVRGRRAPTRSRRLKPKASRQIEIEDFVDLADIDPVYFEQPYYLIPDKDNAEGVPAARRRDGRPRQGRDRAFRAPVEGGARRDPSRRRRARARDDAVRRRGARARPRAAVARGRRPSRASARRRWRASSSASLTATFDPEKYHDEYREELLALIDKKAAGEEIVAAPSPRSPRRCSTSWPRSKRASSGPARSRRRADAHPPRRLRRAARRRSPAKRAAGEEGGREEGVGEEDRAQAHAQVGLTAGYDVPTPMMNAADERLEPRRPDLERGGDAADDGRCRARGRSTTSSTAASSAATRSCSSTTRRPTARRSCSTSWPPPTRASGSCTTSATVGSAARCAPGSAPRPATSCSTPTPTCRSTSARSGASLRIVRTYQADVLSGYRLDRRSEGFRRTLYSAVYNLLDPVLPGLARPRRELRVQADAPPRARRGRARAARDPSSTSS